MKKMKEMIKKDEVIPFTIEQFFKFLEQKKLMAAKCEQCQSIYIPPRPICTNCFSQNLGWIQLKPKGKLITFTIIHLASEKFQAITPYAYGIIELENGQRLPGMILDIEFEQLNVGMDLIVEFQTQTSPEWPQWPKYFFKPP
jgi:uncharacterized OB-fold protein